MARATHPEIETLSVGQRDNRQSIADRMEALAIELRSASDREVNMVPTQEAFLGLAAKVYAARRSVDKVFGISSFATSPGWDIVLDLYQAKLGQKQISVTSACIGGACAQTTGLRWLQVLEDLQLLARIPDPNDKRRTVVELTEAGRLKVEAALAAHL